MAFTSELRDSHLQRLRVHWKLVSAVPYHIEMHTPTQMLGVGSRHSLLGLGYWVWDIGSGLFGLGMGVCIRFN